MIGLLRRLPVWPAKLAFTGGACAVRSRHPVGGNRPSGPTFLDDGSFERRDTLEEFLVPARHIRPELSERAGCF